ncbi:unnamed protein product [Amoebophrya sp. A25]|nr:unnamed protein product [Amoebophrya sp. A25]|eukprot:GSA25T00002896001.1
MEREGFESVLRLVLQEPNEKGEPEVDTDSLWSMLQIVSEASAAAESFLHKDPDKDPCVVKKDEVTRDFATWQACNHYGVATVDDLQTTPPPEKSSMDTNRGKATRRRALHL